ncbi:MAG: hypothetical protein AAF203_07190, partial [Pseudomonadota bacterium]
RFKMKKIGLLMIVQAIFSINALAASFVEYPSDMKCKAKKIETKEYHTTELTILLHPDVDPSLGLHTSEAIAWAGEDLGNWIPKVEFSVDASAVEGGLVYRIQVSNKHAGTSSSYPNNACGFTSIEEGELVKINTGIREYECYINTNKIPLPGSDK